jgi:hypothetical protein
MFPKNFGVGPINVAPLKIKNYSCKLNDQPKGAQDYNHSYFGTVQSLIIIIYF